ncbi:hypothetical protein B484DRAFT_471089, partial [Ochromonadaceae sp. CCMP2298]
DPSPPAAEGGSQVDAALSLPSRDVIGGNQAHTHLPAAPGRDLLSAREDPEPSEPQGRAPNYHEPRRDGSSEGRRALSSPGRWGAAHDLVDEPLEQTLQRGMVGRQAPGGRGNSRQEQDGDYSAEATGGGGGPEVNFSRAGTTRTEGAEHSTAAVARSSAHPSTERMQEVKQEAGDDPIVPSVQPGVQPSKDSTPMREVRQAQGQHPDDREWERGGTSSVHGRAEGHEGEDGGKGESEKRRSEEKREGQATRAGPATRSRTTLTRGEVQCTVDDPDALGAGSQAPPVRKVGEGPRSKVRELLDRRGRGVQGRALELGRSRGRTGSGRLTSRSLIEPRHAILAQLDSLSEADVGGEAHPTCTRKPYRRAADEFSILKQNVPEDFAKMKALILDPLHFFDALELERNFRLHCTTTRIWLNPDRGLSINFTRERVHASLHRLTPPRRPRSRGAESEEDPAA